MAQHYPSISTDQVAAFVRLAGEGSLRAAAQQLHLSQQGLRNRLVALEQRLGVELYHKSRGMRKRTPLTPQGKQFLPHAVSFLERSQSLCELFSGAAAPREVHVVASQYLLAYVLLDAVRQFHQAHPDINVRLTAQREREIEQSLCESPEIALGVAAPYEASPQLEYAHLFSMEWSVITPPRHALQQRSRVQLKDLADLPLILYEKGSTGRQHVMEAFQQRQIQPRVAVEATNTDLIVRMVEAGLGISLVPLLPSGEVTRGRRVKALSLGRQIRAIDSGILLRRGEPLSEATQDFVRFVRQYCRQL